jgi:hypothetical protein
MRTIAKGLFPVELEGEGLPAALVDAGVFGQTSSICRVELANNDDRAASPVCIATIGNRSCAGFSFGRALVESDARVNRAQSF